MGAKTAGKSPVDKDTKLGIKQSNTAPCKPNKAAQIIKTAFLWSLLLIVGLKAELPWLFLKTK
jgi:hypothetical protein